MRPNRLLGLSQRARTEELVCGLGRQSEQPRPGRRDDALPGLNHQTAREELAAILRLAQRLVVGLVMGEPRPLLVEVEGGRVRLPVKQRQGVAALVGVRPTLDGRLQRGQPALDGADVHPGQLGQAVGGFEAHGSRCGTWHGWC